MCEGFFKHMFSNILCIHLEVELLGRLVSMFNLLRNCQALSKVAASFYIFISNVWGFQFTHILGNTFVFVFLIIDIPMGVKWHLIVVSIFISLTTNDVDHLFTYFLAISISFLKKYLFKYFVLLNYMPFIIEL